jgi:hypothetical protein
MFEPGQRIVVTKSSIKGTGPRVGSMGFVSQITGFQFGLFMEKVVWFRYGFEQKQRVETNSFNVLPDPKQIPPIGARISGMIKPLNNRMNINDMTEKEFTCWLHSLCRLASDPADLYKLREKGVFSGSFSPGSFRWDRARDRKEYADIARTIKARIIKNTAAYLYMEFNRCQNTAHAMYRRRRAEFNSVSRFATHTMCRHTPETALFRTLFYLLTYTNFINKEVLKDLPNSRELSALYRVWKIHMNIRN